MPEGLHVKPKDNEKIRKEIEDHIQSILDNNYQDLGGGNSKFLAIEALTEIIDYCHGKRDQLGIYGLD